METWERIPATEQVEIIIKAARSAAHKAYAFSGVPIDYREIMGQTWENTVKGLSADRLSKANAKRATEGKAPLTIEQIAFRAAHAAAELWRWHLNKDRETLPYDRDDETGGGRRGIRIEASPWTCAEGFCFAYSDRAGVLFATHTTATALAEHQQRRTWCWGFAFAWS